MTMTIRGRWRVVDPGRTVSLVDTASDVLARVDGFNVLAPGWGKCLGVRPVVQIENRVMS